MGIFACGFNLFGQLNAADGRAPEPDRGRVATPKDLGPALGEDESVSQCAVSWSQLTLLTDRFRVIILGAGGEAGARYFEGFPVGEVASAWTRTFLTGKDGSIAVCVGVCQGPRQLQVENLKEGARVGRVLGGDCHTVGVLDDDSVGELKVTRVTETIIECCWRELTPALKVKTAACGNEHVLLLTQTGTILSYGIGSRGQLGHCNTETVSEPRVVEALEGIAVMSIETGGWHSAAVTKFGDLYMWGWNESGQLGLPSKQRKRGADDEMDIILIRAYPTIISVPCDRDISQVACGSRHTAAVNVTGELLTCGWNAYGQLGHSDFKDRDSLELVDSAHFDKYPVVGVFCGYWNTVIITKVQ